MTDRPATSDPPPPPTPVADSHPAVRLPLADELPAGTRLGRYKVMRLIGRGGMGSVYLGWDGRLRRKVALKVLSAEAAADREARARFLREGRAAAAVSDDHVVAVYETGQHGRTFFLAMQYLHGVPLNRYLDDHGRPPVKVVVRVAREVASGLAAAHARGLLHRDIKPGNILLEAPKGRVKILDFGLVAPFAPGDEKLTETGMVVGTPAYMSPEQARSGKLDHRSDLFSLGVVLYQMCTGRVPFAGGDAMSVLTALVTRVPEPVGRFNPAIPLRLELLVERLLDKSPAGRPQSAVEVVADLKSIERDLAGRGSASVSVADAGRTPAEPAEPAAEPPATELLPEPPAVDHTPPPPLPRRRSTRTRTKPVGLRAQRQRRERQRRVYLAAVAGVFAVGVLAIVAVTVKAFGRMGTPATPPAAPDRETTGRIEPRPEPPPPPWWRPGMPPPPDHRPPPR